jgi:hypothetical protein
MSITAYTVARTLDNEVGEDMTADFANFLSVIPDGSTVDFGGARVHIEGTAALTQRRGLTFIHGETYAVDKGPMFSYYTAKGVLVVTDRSKRSHWSLTECDDIGFDDFAITSTNTVSTQKPGYGDYLEAYEGEHGIALYSSTNTQIENTRIRGVWGDNIYTGISDPKVSRECQGLYVAGCTLAWNGRQGMGITGLMDAVIENSVIENSRRAAFDLEPNTIEAGIHNVTFRGNTSGSFGMPFPMRGHGHMSDITIADHTLTAASFPYVYVETAGNAIEETNRARIHVDGFKAPETGGSDRWLFEFADVDGVEVSGVTATLRATRKGRCVRTDGCTGYVRVTGNRFINGKDITVNGTPPEAVDVAPGQFA